MRYCLSVMYEVNQSSARLVIPIEESLFKSMVWSIVPKAEDKSRSIIKEPKCEEADMWIKFKICIISVSVLLLLV